MRFRPDNGHRKLSDVMDAGKRDRELHRMQSEMEQLWWQITRDEAIPAKIRAWIKERRYLRDETIQRLRPYFRRKGLCDRYLNLHRQMQRLRTVPWKEK
jgi:hypothetical protein